ncbi:SDR family oxidoreductase [Microbacterium murale]|uniref:NAD(P)-dependent dehydrogenase (Short-subunit alcohol dehydrogenase family) n=1 Tax=Microbacterium murale TaxID=1081040 RepID=A0ABU0P614_9MICO|nr:SDR family oxidoreductase [Microbacterium murale]MDQ0642768.1 NAD(P)-dependent dehydrogenase (short-subunit alcohol dehydrogenase family) [Microbacterium murale]
MGSRARIYVVTGADSGLGKAVAERLAARGEVITCGMGGSVDVQADLTAPSGRAHLLDEVRARGDGRLDGLVAAAGMGSARAETIALNYFGTIAVLEGLRESLAASEAPSAVVVSSSSTLNRGSRALLRACIRGDEAKALATAHRLVRTGRGSQIYRSSKIALNHWVRAASVAPEWAGRGVVLNAVAPGIIATDIVMRTWERDRALLEIALPQPLGIPGPVGPVADLLVHLASPENRFMTGQIIYCDGGTDALTRGSRPQGRYLRYRPREIVSMLRESRRQQTS